MTPMWTALATVMARIQQRESEKKTTHGQMRGLSKEAARDASTHVPQKA